ncbi:MAG: hypothetical protein LBB47_03785, partial [Spirochaetaceae bacterium]|nr:hypothetical protein [Spirochaetaceae bacterium]
NAAGYVLDGEATVKKNFGITLPLLIKENGVFTVNIPGVIDTSTSPETWPALWIITDPGQTPAVSITGENGSSIVVTAQTVANYFGKIILQTVNGTVNNYYDNSGTLLPVTNSPANPQVQIDYGTYNWTADCNSSASGEQSGWLKQ